MTACQPSPSRSRRKGDDVSEYEPGEGDSAFSGTTAKLLQGTVAGVSHRSERLGPAAATCRGDGASTAFGSVSARAGGAGPAPASGQ